METVYIMLRCWQENKKVPHGSGTYKFGFAEFLVVSRYAFALVIFYRKKASRTLVQEF